tara:strand:+ start:82 stop:351 length:270 start_codon:yes stop_codon:yes gene_type:complete
MQLNEFISSIKVNSKQLNNTLVSTLAKSDDAEVVDMFNEAVGNNTNECDLAQIGNNLFSRKLKKLRNTNATPTKIDLLADLVAITFYKK